MQSTGGCHWIQRGARRSGQLLQEGRKYILRDLKFSPSGTAELAQQCLGKHKLYKIVWISNTISTDLYRYVSPGLDEALSFFHPLNSETTFPTDMTRYDCLEGITNTWGLLCMTISCCRKTTIILHGSDSYGWSFTWGEVSVSVSFLGQENKQTTGIRQIWTMIGIGLTHCVVELSCYDFNWVTICTL